jgi:hypothetical protein
MQFLHRPALRMTMEADPHGHEPVGAPDADYDDSTIYAKNQRSGDRTDPISSYHPQLLPQRL